MKIILVLITALLFLIGLFSPFIAELLNQLMGTNISINSFDSNYLMTVIASMATLASIFFVIYGWYSVKELPITIDRIVTEKLKTETDKFNKQINAFAEASQKMNAVYSITDPNKKIIMLEKIIELYPNMFNARITMAYTYWYDKKDYDKAEEWFEKELQDNPNNINALCDMVALYDGMNEDRNAISHAKKAISIDNKAKDYLLNDKRLKAETKDLIKKL